MSLPVTWANCLAVKLGKIIKICSIDIKRSLILLSGIFNRNNFESHVIPIHSRVWVGLKTYFSIVMKKKRVFQGLFDKFRILLTNFSSFSHTKAIDTKQYQSNVVSKTSP
jgi:hypothetical protein